MPTPEHQQIAQAIGYPFSEELDVLGLCYNMGCPGTARYSKRAWTQVRARLKAIAYLSCPGRLRQILIRQLVILVFSWASGYACMEFDTLRSLRSDFRLAAHGRALVDTLQVLLFNNLGWDLDPLAGHDMNVMKAPLRFS